MKETTNPLFQFAQENTNFLSLWCSACHWFSVNRFPPVLLRPVMIFLVPKHKKIYISEIAERDHYEPWHRSPLSHGSPDVINTVEINTVWSNDIITIATRNSANDECKRCLKALLNAPKEGLSACAHVLSSSVYAECSTGAVWLCRVLIRDALSSGEEQARGGNRRRRGMGEKKERDEWQTARVGLGKLLLGDAVME